MLVDTSVWVDHFRRRNPRLVESLEAVQVATHPFVIGELACGNLARRADIIEALLALPYAPVVEHAEVLAFIESARLSGRGLGLIDVHLLASARLGRMSLWTLDKRLAAAARELSLEIASS
jgi:hypothetical protein